MSWQTDIATAIEKSRECSNAASAFCMEMENFETEFEKFDPTNSQVIVCFNHKGALKSFNATGYFDGEYFIVNPVKVSVNKSN